MSERRYRRQNSRFQNSELEIVWAAIGALDIAQKMALLEGLAEETAQSFLTTSAGARETRAVVALCECRSLLGHSPSVSEYERERQSNPQYGWPPEATVRRWVGAGSWNKALERAGLNAIAGGDVIVRQRLGAAFSTDEAILALQLCAKDLGAPPTHHELFRWCKRPDVMALPGRRPLSIQVYIRLFKSYVKALEAAGLCGDGIAAVSAHGVFRTVGGWDHEDFLKALCEVASRIGHPPARSEYRRERRRIEDESLEAGAPRTIPGEDAIARAFGGDWSAAIVAAGLADAATARMTRPPRYTDEDLIGTLQEAREAIRDPFTSTAFKQWRVRSIAEAKAAGTPRYIPSFEQIRNRFKTWNAALEAAFPSSSTGAE